MKKLLCLILCLGLFLVGCSSNDSKSSDSNSKEDTSEESVKETKKLKVGTFASSGIAAEAGVKPLENMGYEIEVVYFDDAVLPNTALQEGSIDFNIFQHTPYLEEYLKDNSGVELSMAELLYYPNYGLYSTKHDSIEDLPDNAVIGLYSDASNVDRGLRILDSCGLITLIDEEKSIYSEVDIIENPKNITFELVNFGTAVRSLDDLDACMAASSHILDGGLDPKKALVLEDKTKTSADFTCGIAVRTEDLDSEWLKDVIEGYKSDESRDYINENYKGASVPVF